MIAAASIGKPLVSSTLSPGHAPPVVISRSGATSPSSVPTTIGRSRPWVISVWPPTSVIPSGAHAARICPKIASASAASARPPGNSTVAIIQRGVAPVVARSLAFTWTAYQPIWSVAKVIGIGLGDQIAVAHVDHGGVFPHAGADDHARIGRDALEQCGQEVRGKFTEGELAVRHAPQVLLKRKGPLFETLFSVSWRPIVARGGMPRHGCNYYWELSWTSPPLLLGWQGSGCEVRTCGLHQFQLALQAVFAELQCSMKRDVLQLEHDRIMA